ncbi:MAG: MobF family relaxase [Acidimicrobiales bacterium]
MAGYDYTFSVPKSVSALWAVADPAAQAAIVEAHHAAVADVIALMERDVAATRVGDAGVAQVATRGLIATAYDHYDSRAADPQLHTHAVTAKVQGEDGKWRALDGRPMHQAVVALSEHYNALLADYLTRALGVGWEQRDRGADARLTGVSATHDRIGIGYEHLRKPDRRLAAAIVEALGDARTVVNVGAGAGSYEPTAGQVVAVEPSAVMLDQHRGPRRVQATAEALPFPDKAFDAAMAIMTIHHWTDLDAGLAEMCRVAQRQGSSPGTRSMTRSCGSSPSTCPRYASWSTRGSHASMRW